MRTIFGRSLVRLLFAGFAASNLGFGQSILRFKTRQIDTSAAVPIPELRNVSVLGRTHLLLQFEAPPSPEMVAELIARGVNVLQDVPDNGLLVSIERPVAVGDMGVRYAAPLDASDKLSPLVRSSVKGFVVVEFHPDVDANRARGLMLGLGLLPHENPDLQPHHLMINASVLTLLKVARLDDVAFIFPASEALIRRIPTRACAGGVTINGPTAQSIPTYGNGWDGPGLGAATISYVFSQMTAKLDPAAAQDEIERAMAQWAAAVQVTWRPGSNATGGQTVNILFASGAHGDGYPFDGLGGVLAHTFYPAPPNPEPIAGDMHFDDAESWHIGANTDLFSVALHELGHSLGLGHADDPSAVMYPYYRMVTVLSPLDISAAQTMYAAHGPSQNSGGNTPAPTPVPSSLTLTVNASAAATTAAAINLTGTAAGGTGAISVIWSSSMGLSGSAQGSNSWAISAIPIATGSNTITVTAISGGARVSRSVAVTRQAATPTTPADTTPPALTIVSPSSTAAASIALSGVASDNVGVTAVTWSTNTGQSGVASGTTQWNATVPLLVGSNTIIVRASDAAGNTGWRSVVVARH